MQRAWASESPHCTPDPWGLEVPQDDGGLKGNRAELFYPSFARPDSRGRLSPRGFLAAAYADVFESHGAEADGVEQVFGVHNQRTAEGLFDTGEIQGTKFWPAGADD
jgi:hypothetical protein